MVLTDIERCIGISQPDGDPTFEFLAVTIGPDARQSTDECRLPMIDMTDNADIDTRYGDVPQ